MQPTTIREFDAPANFLEVLDAWAKETDYKLLAQEGTTTRYQCGTGFLVAPMLLNVTLDGGRVRLEAWVYSNLLVRLMSLFILPERLPIESGGFRGVLPRNIARGKVNKLMERLGQPPPLTR
ncbi:MAG: hypothetical protein AB1758_09190 [Candidatus Eremiobacterota bacterium]